MHTQSVNLDLLASDWLRTLRGKRSQLALSRALGYRSNIAYRWESGRCYPTAAAVFGLVERSGGNVRQALTRFYRTPPPWLEQVNTCSSEGVAQLLSDLKGGISLTALAQQCGYSRYQLSRWLSGKSHPTLLEFLTVVEASSRRVLDFVASFADPATMPSVKEEWARLVEARELAYQLPWTHAVLKALSLEGYTQLKCHDPHFIPRATGADPSVVAECLAVLERTQQVHWNGQRYEETAPDAVDTRSDPTRARELKAWWARVALERLEGGDPGLFSYNLSAVSRRDLSALEQLHRNTYREMMRIIAGSQPAECVVLYNAQFLPLERRVGHHSGWPARSNTGA
jgi:transcriptional regulator with XRE-family HTH domain